MGSDDGDGSSNPISVVEGQRVEGKDGEGRDEEVDSGEMGDTGDKGGAHRDGRGEAHRGELGEAHREDQGNGSGSDEGMDRDAESPEIGKVKTRKPKEEIPSE